ncbi:unnamed protein product [Durusdinium trenchii]|uniref:Uncharacterized protein n=2 Tax=Durusdinium trenchii TaxID=1381693 RepID=A0ABP0IRE5_9DINO
MAESGKGGMLRQVMQKVSKVFNRGLMRKDSSKKAEDLDVDSDFDPENDELPLSTRENILGRRDSRFIMADSFELRREFPGLDIKPRLIFDHPSIEQLSEAIVNLPKADVEPAVSEGTSTRLGGSTGESSAYVSRFTQLTEYVASDAVTTVSYETTGMDDVFIRSSDGMECVLIPAACARIGDDGKFEGGDNEGPSHEVNLESFLMDIEPVSVGAYARFLSMVHPSQEQLLDWCILPEEDERCCHIPIMRAESGDGWQVKSGVPVSWPMILVSWYGANAYALWAHGEDWSQYKSAVSSFLPTEAQWEYGARGANPARFPWGNTDASEELLNVCWDASVYEGVSHVATPLTELPLVSVNVQMGVSPFGLRGMAGNVWQWCRDTYHENFYLSSDASAPNAWNSEAGDAKSERGGSWVGGPQLARSSYRRGRIPEAKGRCLGFRCCAPSTRLA